jgi:hypothetical protein
MFEEIPIMVRLVYWGFVGICPDWWPWPIPPRRPRRWPPPPPPWWKLSGALAGIAVTFWMTGEFRPEQDGLFTSFILSGAISFATSAIVQEIGRALSLRGSGDLALDAPLDARVD